MKRSIFTALLLSITAFAGPTTLPDAAQDYLDARRNLQSPQFRALPDLMAEYEVNRLRSIGEEITIQELMSHPLGRRILGPNAKKPPTAKEIAGFLAENRNGKVEPALTDEQLRDLMIILRKENGRRRGGDPTDRSLAREALSGMHPETIPPLSEEDMSKLRKEYNRLHPKSPIQGPLTAAQILSLMDNPLAVLPLSAEELKGAAGRLVEYQQMENPGGMPELRDLLQDINFALRSHRQPELTLDQLNQHFQGRIPRGEPGQASPFISNGGGALPMTAPELRDDPRLQTALAMRNPALAQKFRSHRMNMTRHSSPNSKGSCNGGFVGPTTQCNAQGLKRAIYATADHCLPPEWDTDEIVVEGIGLVDEKHRHVLRQPGLGASDDFSVMLMDIPCAIAINSIPVCPVSQVGPGSVLVANMSNISENDPTKRMVVAETFDLAKSNFQGVNVMGSYNYGAGIFPGDSGSPVYGFASDRDPNSACYAGAVSAKYLELPFNAQNKLGKIATGGSLSTLQTWMMAEAYLPMEQLKESSLGTSKGNHGNKVSLR